MSRNLRTQYLNTHRKFIQCFGVVLLSLLLSGCFIATEFEDFTSIKENNDLIGQRYRLRTDLYIYGIDLPPGYRDEIDRYRIQNYRITPGREVRTSSILPVDTILIVTNVQRCTNCSDRNLILIVDVFESNMFSEADISIMTPYKFQDIVPIIEENERIIVINSDIMEKI